MPIPIDAEGKQMYIPESGTIINSDSTKVVNIGKVNRVKGTVDSVKPVKPVVPSFKKINHQSDGTNTLKRIEFEFQKKSYKFTLNPEEYTQEEPSRTTLTMTKSGGWIDDFGGGAPTISFKGTTGFKRGTKSPTKGFEKFFELRNLIREFYFKVAPGTNVTGANELTFHNYTDGEHWIVTPQVFTLTRSVSRPLMYVYNIQLIAQRPADQPAFTTSSSVDKSVTKVDVGGK